MLSVHDLSKGGYKHRLLHNLLCLIDVNASTLDLISSFKLQFADQANDQLLLSFMLSFFGS